jgi:hypothetical protein
MELRVGAQIEAEEARALAAARRRIERQAEQEQVGCHCCVTSTCVAVTGERSGSM